MALLKTTAIVLKKLRLNEADNILTLLTAEGSKISAVAKGIRKTKSKFSGRLEPFSVVDLVLYEGKTLYTITQANTVTDNSHLQDYERFLAASAIADLINQVTFEKGGDSRLYVLLLEALCLLKENKQPLWLVVVFDWKVIQALGLAPSLEKLCACNGPAYLDLGGEGLVCRQCQVPEKRYIALGPSTLALLGDIMDSDIGKAVIMKDGEYGQLTMLTGQYLSYQLELKLKSRSLIG